MMKKRKVGSALARAGTILLLLLLTSSAGALAQERDRLSAEFALGLGIDNFAASELLTVLNPEDANDTGGRFVGGFGIDYRLVKGLWVSVYTVHGVRSSEVDCSGAAGQGGGQDGDDPADPMPPTGSGSVPAVCALESLDLENLNVGDAATFILKEATSLEGGLALRWEFAQLDRDDDGKPAGAVYFVARAGFLSVQGSSSDVIDNHMVGFGAMITEDRFRGSFLEAGMGRTQLFGDKSSDRLKARALLKWKFKEESDTETGLEPLKALGAYAGIVVDTDGGSGSDSIQSYFGFSFDVAKFLGS